MSENKPDREPRKNSIDSEMDRVMLLTFMQQLARDAGELVKSERGPDGPTRAEMKADMELVTEADIKVDAFICETIRSRFPEHRILAEESAPDSSQIAQPGPPMWIIDPIDGTVNYAHGHFQVAVSIAYVEDGQVQCGVVYNPFLDEMYCARAGGGAFLNNRAISVSGQRDLRRALVATGFPYKKENLAPLIRRLSLVLERCADIRRLGSAAMDICWVAVGRLDAYYESLSVWDFAAAQLIAIEAGAQYGHFQPVPEGVSPVFHNQNILVTSPALFEPMKALLQEADAD